ncbi:MAG: DUF4097 family beta strand repeat-containing protein [Proteobacteria bacterium]|nr:DUF4097 family beta strand repeat-containing protein [Pseudomonadota bacterium]
MNKRVQTILIVLVLFSVGSFILAQVFDSRCKTSCIGEAFAENSAHGFKGFDNININVENSSTTEVFNSKDLKDIVIKSNGTNWTITEAADDKGTLQFTGYRLTKEWTLSPSAGKLSIETTGKGPNEATLKLPKDFDGKIVLVTSSGDVTIEKLAKTNRLELTDVSGDIQINASPSQDLLINTVSGDVEFKTKELSPALTLGFHSTSGDLKADLVSPMKSFKAKTISGNIELIVAKGVGFAFELEGISSSYDGLPEGTEALEGAAHHRAIGSFGLEPKGELSFKSVSGDFHLKHAE